MPELPEVESARRLAGSALSGRKIVQVATVNDHIVYSGVSPVQFAAKLRGRRVRNVRRRGKYLWIELDRRPWPLVHFGMGGRFYVYRMEGERPRYWKMELQLDDGTRLAMTNARRLGRIRLLDDPENEPPISRLGFDLLLDLPSAAEVGLQLARRKGPIKAVLLDQSFSAGVGNWVADEILYQARIAPKRRADRLEPDEVKRLRSAMRRVCRTAVGADADSNRFPKNWLFHYRWGRTAVTGRGEKVIRQTIGGRTTAWVPAVQK